MTTKTAEKREYLTAEEIETETVKLETLMDRLEQIAQALDKAERIGVRA